jgi:hypothetical protein
LHDRLRAGCRTVAEELSLEKAVAALERIYAEQHGTGQKSIA